MHPHSNDHDHHRHGQLPGAGRAFAIGIALNIAFVLVEWTCGVLANSLSLVADATHNFSDVLGLALAWGAMMLARRPPSMRFTYGLRGSTVLAALANAMLLLVATGGIAWEAILRFQNHGAVDAPVVIWVAALGVAINAGTAMLFMAGRKTDLNIRGAYLHMAADAGVSLGVVVAGIGMAYTRWTWLDPVASLLIVMVICISTWRLLRDSVKLALHAAPENVDPQEVRRYLAGLPGVAEVHDLHIWAMSTTETALTVHLVMPAGHPGDEFFSQLVRHIEDRFRIGHATVQIETGTSANPCILAPDHVV
ncbi:MAG: cation transporter [Betaproteobacteria bacterium]|nr:cation transporter [Betaproteobacteria bacterium]